MIDGKLITSEISNPQLFVMEIKNFKEASPNVRAEDNNKKEITESPPSICHVMKYIKTIQTFLESRSVDGNIL